MVFEAIDLRNQYRHVAVKVINPPGADPGFLVRIEREIKILSSLSHPNVVAYFGSGVLPDGRIYLVLEWLSGKDLADLKQDHPLPLGQVLEIGKQVAGALAAAHEQGVVHRDIKPSNIFLIDPRIEGMPNVRVIDFGVAKNEDTQSGALTRAGAILGTPAYMAPEQASHAMTVDARADVFSLGVVLYELISGKLPWTSRSDLARLARILTERAISLGEAAAGVPREAIELIDSMVAHRTEDRPQNMRRVHERLVRCSESVPRAALDAIYSVERPDLERFVREETAAAKLDDTKPLPKSPPRSPSIKLAKVETIPTLEATEKLEDDEPQTLGVGFKLEPDIASLEAHRIDVEAPPVRRSSSVPPRKDSVESSVQLRRGLPFIGRRAILDRLVDDVKRALTEKKPAALGILGPAGIGKTRLRSELSRALKGIEGTPLILAGRVEDSARSSPYGFLRRVLLAEAKIYPSDPPDLQRLKLERLIPDAADLTRHRNASITRPPGMEPIDPKSEERTRFARFESWTERPSLVAVMSDAFDFERESPLVAGEEDRELVLAFVAEALHLQAGTSERDAAIEAARRDPRVMSAETRRSLELVLRELAAKRGLVFLVDDAHLLDRQSAVVLRDLLRVQKGDRIAVVAFALPTILDEPPDGRAPWPQGKISMSDLPPLDGSAARNLTRLLVEGQIRSDALEVLASRSGGNPLYLEQLVRAVRETGVLAPLKQGGEHVLAGLKGDAQDNERIPPTIAAAVRARYEVLDKKLQSALAAAAAYGEIFWAEGVAHVLGEDLEETMGLLDRLTALDLIRRRGTSRYHLLTEMEFAHGVIRIVVLSRVRRDLRRELEKAVVSFLEKAGETDAAALAAHKVHAGAREDAARLYAEAAAASLSSGDFGAATALADEGLLIAEGGDLSPAIHATLLELAARSCALSDRLDEADHALEILSRLSLEPEKLARVGEERSQVALRLRRFDEARRFATEAAEKFEELGLSALATEARLAEAEAAEEMDDDRTALRGYVQAQGVLDPMQHRGMLSRATRGLARVALCSGDYRTAEGRFRSSLVHARAARDLAGTIDALVGLGVVSRRLGEYERAQRYFEGAERLVTDRQTALWVWARRAVLSAETGKREEAEKTLEALADEAKGRSFIEVWIGATLLRAELALGFGRTGLLSQNEAKDAAAKLSPALESARSRAPSLVLPLEVALGFATACAGEGARGWTLAGSALGRFDQKGTVHEDEPPRLFLAHAGTLVAAGAPQEALRESRRQAVLQLDLILSRLDRPLRERYLARPLAKAVIAEAEKSNLALERDARSHRLTLK